MGQLHLSDHHKAGGEGELLVTGSTRGTKQLKDIKDDVKDQGQGSAAFVHMNQGTATQKTKKLQL